MVNWRVSWFCKHALVFKEYCPRSQVLVQDITAISDEIQKYLTFSKKVMLIFILTLYVHFVIKPFKIAYPQ